MFQTNVRVSFCRSRYVNPYDRGDRPSEAEIQEAAAAQNNMALSSRLVITDNKYVLKMATLKLKLIKAHFWSFSSRSKMLPELSIFSVSTILNVKEWW